MNSPNIGDILKINNRIAVIMLHNSVNYVTIRP